MVTSAARPSTVVPFRTCTRTCAGECTLADGVTLGDTLWLGEIVPVAEPMGAPVLSGKALRRRTTPTTTTATRITAFSVELAIREGTSSP